MIQILHGEHIVQSRAQLGSLMDAAHTAGKTVERSHGKQLTLNQLELLIERQELFAHPRCIVIEELLSTTASKKKTAMLEYLEHSLSHFTQSGDELILWESKQLTAKQTPSWPGISTTNFTLSSSLFGWLDEWRGNWTPVARSRFLAKSQTIMNQEGADFCLIMLQRQLRFWLEVHLGIPPSMPPFVVKKITLQAQSFTLAQLERLHQELTAFDLKQKNSQLLLSASQQLELLILTL